MIYTVTFNPALDYIIDVDDFQTGKTNRTVQEQILPGGKGINVSIVLNNLGFKNTALGFVAGFTGSEIKRCLETQGCLTDFIQMKSGFSRINVKMKSGAETEINGQGPFIGKEEVALLFAQLNEIKDGDVLILAGSIPQSIPDTVYKEILTVLMNKKIITVVDATKDLLFNVLEYHPFLIKPNKHELGDLFGVELSGKEEVTQYAQKLQTRGARNVLVSMAGEGAVLLTEDGQVFMSEAPKGKLISSVGAGDSMVAGFIAGWLEKKEYSHAFKTGLAAGSASAFSHYLATREKVDEIYSKL